MYYSIITNNEIAKNNLQTPFVCFLVQVYLCNKRQLKCPVEDPNDVISLLASLKYVTRKSCHRLMTFVHI